MASVLVVDDAIFMRISLRNTLEKLSHTVVGEAANGEEAIDKYSIHQPDLCLMDITMPEVDGIAAIKGIRSKHPQAKIIVVSSMGQKHMVLEAMKAGAAHFVVKPFSEQSLVDAINKVLPPK